MSYLNMAQSTEIIHSDGRDDPHWKFGARRSSVLLAQILLRRFAAPDKYASQTGQNSFPFITPLP